MASKNIRSFIAKAVGIDLDARYEQVPKDLAGRATCAVAPFDPYFEAEPTVQEWIRECIPSKRDVLPYLSSLFPFTNWICRYNVRWLVGDVIAGVTLGLVVVPQAMAYALLANLSPEYGLYTSFTGASLYWLFGTSKDIAIGATAVVSLLVGKAGTRVRDQYPEFTPEDIAKTHAFLAGCILLVFGLLRLDWIIELIPHVAIAAFVTGAAITITLSQTPALLGIEGINSKGPAYEVFINTCKGLGRTKLDAAVGLTGLLLLALIKWYCDFMAKRQPGRVRLWNMLCSLRLTFTILLYTLVSFLVHRNISLENQKFRILGQLPTGFSHAGPPKLDTKLMSALLPELPATVIILIIEHIAIGKSFGRINNYVVVPSQELISIGCTNLLGPFIGAYSSTGSFGGTAILSKAGVRTPLAGIFNGVILLLALYALTSVLYYIPMASLAALIIHAVYNLITTPDHLYKTWLTSPLDVFIYFVGVFVSVFTSLENGIYCTVALSAAVLLVRLARAKGQFLGRTTVYRYPRYTTAVLHKEELSALATTLPRATPTKADMPCRDIFLPLKRHDATNPNIHVHTPHSGIFIYRFTEGFNYVNQAQYIDRLSQTIMNQTRRTTTTEYAHPGDRPWNEPAPRCLSKDSDSKDTECKLPILRAVILDCSAVNNMDSGAVEGLIDLRAQLDHWAAPESVEWHFASVTNRWTRRALAVAGFGYPRQCQFEKTAPWEPVFSLAEMGGCKSAASSLAPTGNTGRGDEDSEKGLVAPETQQPGNALAALYGIDRPNFHVDVVAAVEVAVHAVDQCRERSGHEDMLTPTSHSS
ncbi:sulfate permease [Pseudomassariella vexata]|uniref:Sulfate permease n=1 Tax=Pseudomassariella vexata TaxID=1141098 RepID=A0A1Y2E4T1_9PEZI|nr:sulfate permease [Pseudomassariella vexata]ORY66529.1 sulfate permease [Pseudomassariella vexata]